MRVAILCSRVRVEEKLLFEAFASLGATADRIDERDIDARVGAFAPDVDVLLERSVSTSAGLVALQLFEAAGVTTILTSSWMATGMTAPPVERAEEMIATYGERFIR